LKTIFYIFISIVILNTYNKIIAQDFAQVHKLIQEGTSAIYDIDFPAALSKFQQAKTIAPNDLRGSFFESTVYFWKAMFMRNKNDYETYLNLSDILIKKCEDAININEYDLDAQFYLGWTYTIRASLIYMIDQDVLKAASDVKDGNKALLFVVERNPNYYDAYLGLGIYNYMLGMIPRKLQFLTSILGFKGDKEEGKKQLKMAAEKGTYTNTEAKFYLTLLSWREENYMAAEDYASQLINLYPESPATWMVEGLLLSQQDKMNEAVEAYEKALAFNKGKESDIVYKTVYGALGNAYFRMNSFGKAIDAGKKYMNYITKDDRYNNMLYSIGVSLELTGNRSEALNYYRQARAEDGKHSEWEKFWFRKLNSLSERPISSVDSLLIVAENNKAVGKLNEALNDYNTIFALGQNLSTDIQVQINQGTGSVYFKQKEYDKAIDEFKKNISVLPIEEKWLVPESLFQIGRCLLRLGKKSDANDYFNKALDIDYDYDFKDAMDAKIQNELAKF
jgi:tetratricopeptide (TPR) repeat protein